MKSLFEFFKKEAVFVIAALFAVATMFLVPPSENYIGYIDFKVLSLLFCLMAVVAGLSQSGVTSFASGKLLSLTKSQKALGIILVHCCFFFSMLLTNDVSLLTFVPLTLVVLASSKDLLFVIVMETVAANLGSMLTPVGNPQNLFLYSHYNLSPDTFFSAVLPFGLLGYAVLLAILFLKRWEQVPPKTAPQKEQPIKKHFVFVYAGLFLLCLAGVFQLVPYVVCLAVTLFCILLLDWRLLLKIDYCLLLTFVAFFIFVGNLSAMEPVRSCLNGIIGSNELLVGVMTSQVISNVPAAIMLSSFTENAQALLVSTNIGGLGTLIASLASLISFKLYIKSENAKPLRFICVFSIINFSILALLYLAAWLIL